MMFVFCPVPIKSKNMLNVAVVDSSSAIEVLRTRTSVIEFPTRRVEAKSILVTILMPSFVAAIGRS